MKYGIYSVYDNIAEKYGNPYIAISDKVANRDYTVGMSAMNTLVKKDYVLIKIGMFDDITGVVSNCPHLIVSGSIEPVQSDDDDESQIDNLKELVNNE